MNYLTTSTAVFKQEAVYFGNRRVLSRREAKLRLRALTPGTEEHSKLQTVLIRTTGIVEVNLPMVTYKVNMCSKEQLLGGFGSSEHVAIGEVVTLKGLPKDTPLFFKGITPVKFQHIVALAGDFYGVYGEAISLPGGTNEWKTERFKKAFNTLAQAGNEDQVRRIILEIEDESRAIKLSGLPHHCYSNQMMEKNQAFKKIKHDIDKLLIDNSDHFFIHAEDAYRIGHTLALSEAKKAGQQKDLEGLKRAYALDAFACHFLTDLFAAGHIRNQRGALENFLCSQLKFRKNWAKKLAGVLTGAQHEKDGNEGLNVSNQKGEHWRAYGDGCFFESKNKENQEKAFAAIQQSVDEIYQAYDHPDSLTPSIVDQQIPHATPLNPLPLYCIEGTSLFLHRGSNKIEVKTQMDYFNQGLSQVLRYLPEKYINNFIARVNIKFHPIWERVIVPQVERLTESIWGTLGIAAYHQIKQNNNEVNEKIDGIAVTLRDTFENSEKIFQQNQQLDIRLSQIHEQLSQLLWAQSFQKIENAIKAIESVLHGCNVYKDALNDRQLKKAKDMLWEAYTIISSSLQDGMTEDGCQLLLNYKKMLEKTQSLSSREIKIALTLWFRKMLDYQVQAFRTYVALEGIEGKNEKSQQILQSQVLKFESDILKQIEANQNSLDQILIYENQKYIALQLEKSKTKQLAFKAILNKRG